MIHYGIEWRFHPFVYYPHSMEPIKNCHCVIIHPYRFECVPIRESNRDKLDKIERNANKYDYKTSVIQVKLCRSMCMLNLHLTTSEIYLVRFYSNNYHLLCLFRVGTELLGVLVCQEDVDLR